MVTCKLDAVPKMSRNKRASSTSSGFRLLDGDHLDTVSSVSRNSIYKLKIDSMFDDSRSFISQRLEDRRGSQRTESIIMYGSRGLSSTTADSSRSLISSGKNDITNDQVQQDVRRVSNSVQAQIERMFTDVVKDATCSFPVKCLGSLPLKDKVTSLQGLQDPLRQLYLSGAGHGSCNTGNLDICPHGLRVRLSTEKEPQLTPFHNIAVWSAVKFIVSPLEGGAAFLPLITDPENLDKSTLFRPLTVADQRRLSSGLHAPIFAVVMRSSGLPKILECHGFVCHSAEDAIVIAATLYQSLMAHVSTNPNNSTRRRKPRNQNGVSCISIASSSAVLSSHHPSRLANLSVGRKNSLRSSNRIISSASLSSQKPPLVPSRPPRKKRTATSSLSGDSDIVREVVETTTEERKKKSHKTKRAPPIPKQNPPITSSHHHNNSNNNKTTNSRTNSELFNVSMSYLNSKQNRARNSNLSNDGPYQNSDGNTGDILTRVAIPRSGSFLNTSGLTRYKSRATRRHAGKTGGGGGSPLGFSELFNEFKLHENLHSLDDILNAIIDADGMSFNDLKPIYKEFLLKLAVTLTKDELYQRSKNIMRRQKKKKLKRRNSTAQKKNKGFVLGAKGLKKVFWFSHFRGCKSPSKSTKSNKSKQSSPDHSNSVPSKNTQHHRTRTGTSGSDVSEVRNENTLNGINRNSSSGYVSCSECSYDSEACTCVSADRCYCSLGADHDRVNEKLSKTTGARDSLLSCKTEDKCYCSMGETNGESSETTWCDSDSCISTSKCYCKRNQKGDCVPPAIVNTADATITTTTTTATTATTTTASKSKGKRGKPKEKLALDYELFTVGGNGKSVKAHEALSVKKSVEVAAVFADVKLSQTTDIKSLTNMTEQPLRPAPTLINGTVNSTKTNSKRRTSTSTASSSHRAKSGSRKSSSVNDFLSRLDTIEKTSLRKSSYKSESCYQAMRPANVSLEDSLGYLP